MTPGEAAERPDVLVARVEPANLDVVRAINPQGPSKLPAAQAVGS